MSARPAEIPARDDGPAARRPPRLLALLDYDGTMTTHECNEVALQPFVGDPWWELEEESYNDRMSHAEVFDRQIGLIEAPRAELIRRLLEVAEPMPGLHDFIVRLLARGGEAAVVSAGIREAIEAFWSAARPPAGGGVRERARRRGSGRRPAVPPGVQRRARRLPALRPRELQGGDPAPAAPPRRRRARVRRRAERPVPGARGRPRVRARAPGRALRAGGPRVAAAHGLRRRARRRSTTGWRAGERHGYGRSRAQEAAGRDQASGRRRAAGAPRPRPPAGPRDGVAGRRGRRPPGALLGRR